MHRFRFQKESIHLKALWRNSCSAALVWVDASGAVHGRNAVSHLVYSRCKRWLVNASQLFVAWDLLGRSLHYMLSFIRSTQTLVQYGSSAWLKSRKLRALSFARISLENQSGCVLVPAAIALSSHSVKRPKTIKRTSIHLILRILYVSQATDRA